MKKHLSTILLALILLLGLSLLLYPTFSDWWNSFTSSRAIASYSEDVAKLDQHQYDDLWNAAWNYNQSLGERENHFLLSEEQRAQYEALLDISGQGIMGYVEIPAIGVSLPVYHGTAEPVLQVAIGHLDWSSLPVGGEGSHCVVSGHRGLPSARLFTDLDKLTEGDTFSLRVLDEVLTYQVDQILIVEPEDVEPLLILPGEDLCTLVTCTPYGINSHRLLVRGRRMQEGEQKAEVRVSADAMQLEPILIAPFVASPILALLLIVLLIPKRKK